MVMYLFWFVTVGVIEPSFVGAMSNVTVALGREAILSCTVSNLDHFRVSSVRFTFVQLLLFIQLCVIYTNVIVI